MTDHVYWHDGDQTARVPRSCILAIIAKAKDVERVQPATAVAVFTVLALYADGSGDGSRPKVETMAAMLDLSQAQVRRIISSVLIPALVVSKRPWTQNGRKCGTIYTLTRPEAHSPTEPGGALPTEPGEADEPRPRARSNDQPSDQTTDDQTKTPTPTDVGFDKFWSIYPTRNGRKVGKQNALAKWCKLDLDTKRLAYKAAQRYAAAIAAGETLAKDPARFISADYWRDWLDEAEPVPPVAPRRPPHVPPGAVWDASLQEWIG